MKKIRHFTKAKRRHLFTAAIPALLVTVLMGCAANYGSLQSSHEVTEAFENDHVLSDYQYYYNGFERIPYGLIGIDNRYTLRSNTWKPIELHATLLGQWTYRMLHVYSLPPRGAWILDPSGNRVGVWYSSQYYTTVILEKENQIVVFPPKPPDLSGIP